jgi:hypothetical protein
MLLDSKTVQHSWYDHITLIYFWFKYICNSIVLTFEFIEITDKGATT